MFCVRNKGSHKAEGKKARASRNCQCGALEQEHTEGNKQVYTQLYILEVKELQNALDTLFGDASEMRSPNYYFHCAPLL